MIDIVRVRESRAAIEKIYVEIRHFFNRGYYKPFGVSGREMIEALLMLRPEIYGSINDAKKVELDGLVYVIDRLPKGIEECRIINFISEEGYANSGFEHFVPPKRKRNCYRVDDEQYCIEITRGRSELYDILTHLTFLFIESEKIKKRAHDEKGRKTREWLYLEELARRRHTPEGRELEIAITHTSTIVGRTFEETRRAYQRLAENPKDNSGLFHVVYHLGRVGIEEEQDQNFREIRFTPTLRERIGQHIYGEKWANNIKESIYNQYQNQRPLHIISANMHSVLNALFAYPVLHQQFPQKNIKELALELSKAGNQALQQKVQEYAIRQGMTLLEDTAGTLLNVQIFDTDKIDWTKISPEIQPDMEYIRLQKPILIVMDYAFGEQAYECMDELLKPYKHHDTEVNMQVASVNIMGKAGILHGGKGDIMIPTAHVFEGTADNYPVDNQVTTADFTHDTIPVCEGTMITVLGTSLQNKDILNYFKTSSWNAIGLEMEGAHYQKAIQSASRIRKSIGKNVKVSYAYYASDNPLETGHTLASGSLGTTGVKPTYLITLVILNKILRNFA